MMSQQVLVPSQLALHPNLLPYISLWLWSFKWPFLYCLAKASSRQNQSFKLHWTYCLDSAAILQFFQFSFMCAIMITVQIQEFGILFMLGVLSIIRILEFHLTVTLHSTTANVFAFISILLHTHCVNQSSDVGVWLLRTLAIRS